MSHTEARLRRDHDDEWWYNLVNRQVEKGRLSPGVNRVGPFATAEEAARAPELLARRAREWQAEDETDN